MKTLPQIALGTWSWGSGMAGGDQVFGNHTDAASLKSVFEAAYKAGLTMWDTATVYGMGASEDILGGFIKDYPREDFIISTKFTLQIAIAYAINKGTYPIVGATKPRHVEEAATAARIKLSENDIETLEALAAATGVDTKGSWENPMA